MRIASYNIRKAVGLDWRRDADRIADVLAEIDADIVVLQEADRRVGNRAGVLPLDRLADELRYDLVDLSIRPLSHGWHGNAILFRNDIPVARTRRIDIPTIEPRGAVSAILSDPPVEIIGVHLGLTPGKRRQQMTSLNHYIENAPHPVVIAGDFNEWKTDIEVFKETGRMISPGHSYHSARPRAALDRFVIAGPISHEASFVHKSELARVASDHLPIVMEIAFTEPAQ
ncbi:MULTISPECIES: endonuclease/exonuclease/phosphatase family protein [unclassified Roseovarius]|uniref:endonuclease/exonuclease/phosphatase family protein n=1 Tax=unclassified Roseovarius TaxID=2614913 RepID=UPI00273DB46E|nr:MULTISPECIES: endonuclease/exonuclease/phosphatase family protein [unclassified Roseovarius]